MGTLQDYDINFFHQAIEDFDDELLHENCTVLQNHEVSSTVNEYEGLKDNLVTLKSQNDYEPITQEWILINNKLKEENVASAVKRLDNLTFPIMDEVNELDHFSQNDIISAAHVHDFMIYQTYDAKNQLEAKLKDFKNVVSDIMEPKIDDNTNLDLCNENDKFFEKDTFTIHDNVEDIEKDNICEISDPIFDQDTICINVENNLASNNNNDNNNDNNNNSNGIFLDSNSIEAVYINNNDTVQVLDKDDYFKSISFEVCSIDDKFDESYNYSPDIHAVRTFSNRDFFKSAITTNSNLECIMEEDSGASSVENISEISKPTKSISNDIYKKEDFVNDGDLMEGEYIYFEMVDNISLCELSPIVFIAQQIHNIENELYHNKILEDHFEVFFNVKPSIVLNYCKHEITLNNIDVLLHKDNSPKHFSITEEKFYMGTGHNENSKNQKTICNINS